MSKKNIKIWEGEWIIKDKGWNSEKTIFTGEFKNNIINNSFSGSWYGTWDNTIFKGFFKNNNGHIKYIDIERIGKWNIGDNIFKGRYNKNIYENVKYDFKKFIDKQKKYIHAIEELEIKEEKYTHWIWYFFPVTVNDNYLNISYKSKDYLLTYKESYYDIINAAEQYLMYDPDNNNTYYLRKNLFKMVNIIYNNLFKKNNGNNMYYNLIKLFNTSGEVDVFKVLRSLIIFSYAAFNLINNIHDDLLKKDFEKFINNCVYILNGSKKNAFSSKNFKFSTLEIIMYENLDIIKI